MRYVRLFLLFLKSSLLVELEYRANFIAQALLGLFWGAITFSSVALFFSHTDRLGGWTYEQALVIVGLYMVMGGLTSMFLEPNLQRVVAMVRDGTMDFVLMKPVNSQFMATLRHVKFSGLADILAGSAVIVYACAQMDYVPGIGALVLFVLTFGIGLLIIYSIWLTMCACAFIFVRIDNLQELFHALWDTARFPVSAFPGVMRFVLTFILPIAFMTTFPAQAILGTLDAGTFVMTLFIGAALFALGTLVWRRTIRSYSSASS